jgi:hypothetical protein
MTPKHDAPEADLLAALRAAPNLLETTQTEASAAFNAIMRFPFTPRLGVADYWGSVAAQSAAVRPKPHAAFPAEFRAQQAAMVASLRLALDARDLLVAVLNDLRNLSSGEVMRLNQNRDCPGLANQAVHDVMMARPGTAAFQKRRNAELAHRAEQSEQMRARQSEAARVQREQERRSAACALVRHLAQGGVTLAVDGARVTVRPLSLVQPADRAAIADLRTELLALLSEPAAMVA